MRLAVLFLTVFAAVLAPGVALVASAEEKSFHSALGDYRRILPGSHWENYGYLFTLDLPQGGAGCTDLSSLSEHGPILGPKTASCLPLFKHPVASIYATWHDPQDTRGLEGLVQDTCGKSPATDTAMVIGDLHYWRCRHQPPEGRAAAIDYFAFKMPEEIHVCVFCPSAGHCERRAAGWARIILPNLHLNWPDGTSSPAEAR